MSSRPQPKRVFFLDKNLGRHDVADALRSAGHVVEILTDHFPHDTPDAVWVAEVGKRGWTIITKDKKVRSNPLEIRALWQAAVPSFVLTSGQATGQENATTILAAMHDIEELIVRKPWPFIATIAKSGAVRVYLDQADFLKRL